MTLLPAAGPREAARARVATSAGFAAQGYVLLLLLLNLDAFKDRYDVGDGTIDAAMLGVLLAAAVGSGVADWLSRRPGGSRVALAAGLALIAVVLPVVAVAPTFLGAAAALVVYGVALGTVDASTNMQGVATQRVAGRPLTAGFYAAWSCGAIVSTLAVSFTRLAGLETEPVHVLLLTATPVAAAAAVLALRMGIRNDHGAVVGPEVAADGAKVALPWRPMLVLAVAVVAYFAVDNATQAWGTIYLRDALNASEWVAPLVIAPYLITTLISRALGDTAVRRWGRVAVVRTSALVGAAGLVLVIAAPDWPLAMIGFAITGAGLGPIVPMCFSAAGALAPDHADAVIARLNVFNYGGTLLGVVIAGLVGAQTSFRAAYVIPVALVLVVAAIAGRFAVAHDLAGDPVDEPTEVSA
ncbi:MFS transporter [Cellulomonas alba]|uniref:MFS transporter n=1 Tax=Cellulomonas alba TaxID=3053467 RepID=A0ABT7SGV0_9CELL|nr:MFS transporter [Cellulomonas alba]MDM7855396.1 MFS transporter [Cellulomonas alba]